MVVARVGVGGGIRRGLQLKVMKIFHNYGDGYTHL
jgi:hypothetical protein